MKDGCLSRWFSSRKREHSNEDAIETVVIKNMSEVDDHQGRDLLSDLPLSIIHIILALVPIRDAVKTSVLSTQWRYTWTTLPQLVFDNECANKECREGYKYKEIISRVLFLHKGPIHRFRLSCSAGFPNADQWLICLSKNGVQELILDSRSKYRLWMNLQSSLYSCEKLTFLSMYRCELKPPPLTFKGFPFLRCLRMFFCFLTSDDITRIVAGCPLLESFEFCEIQRTELKISAPNLKYICLRGPYEIICINAPLVTEISIFYYYFVAPPDQEELKRSALDYAKCLAGFTNLQKLRGIGYFTKLMSFGIELCHHSLAFRHLKLIDIKVNFENVKEIMVLARLVIGAPSLQQLIIRSRKESYGSDPDLSLDDFGFAPNFKLENLTDVSLVNSDVLPLEIEFLKILFESSPVLETVRVDTQDKQNKVRAILQGCNWASPPIVKPCCEKTIIDRFRRPF